MNKEFTRMLKLAGLMTEGLYTAQMYSEEPVAEVSKKLTKKELKAKIIEMMTPMPDEDTNFEDSYYSTDVNPEYAGTELDEPKMDEFSFELEEDTIGQEAAAEVGSMDEASSEAMDRMSGMAPVSSVGSLIDAARRIISALKEDGFEEEDIYDYIMDKVMTLSIDETLSEAKKDEEEAPEDVDIDVEAPVEDVPDTAVDVNMDGTPDVDTGSPESKKAFTALVDAYNNAKELGDPKLTQMMANALTYYNKNIILKTSQQA